MQVAAHAANHLRVRKQLAPGGDGQGDSRDGRLVTAFECLEDREARLAEIQAMLGLPQAAAEEVLRAGERDDP